MFSLTLAPDPTNTNAFSEPVEFIEGTKQVGPNARLVKGHLGITPAAVCGVVRIEIDPEFTLEHTQVLTRPVLDVSLIGISRTMNKSYVACHPTNMLTWLALTDSSWKENMFLNESYAIGDALDPGLARDAATGKLKTIMPGLYEAPFNIPLPAHIPPSFKSWDVVVSYSFTARLRFKEVRDDRTKVFMRNVQEIVQIRKYLPDHFISTSDALSNRASSPVREFEIRSDVDPMDAPFGQLGMDFAQPHVLTNKETGEPVQYTITLPTRSFGPDDLVTANIHIDKLPDGFVVHHLEFTLEAEIQSETIDGPTVFKELLMKHRDIPKSAGHYWNKEIKIPLFQTSNFGSSESASGRSVLAINGVVGSGSSVDRQSCEPPSVHILSDDIPFVQEDPEQELVDEELPPEFESIVTRRFQIPADFEQRPLATRRSDILQVLEGRSEGERNVHPADDRPIAMDAGFTTGKSSLFVPWVIGRRESSESIESAPSRAGPETRRTQSGDIRMVPSRFPPAMARTLTVPSSSSLRASRSAIESNMSGGSSSAAMPPIPVPEGFTGSHMLAGHSLRVPVVLVGSGGESVGSDADIEQGQHEVGGTSTSPSSACAGSSGIIGSHNAREEAPAYSESESRQPPEARATLQARRATRFGLHKSDSSSSDISLRDAANPLLNALEKLNSMPLEVAERTLKPLTSFSSPTVSVMHTLRLEIVCHKPLPMNMGSRLIYANELQRTQNSSPLLSFWRRGPPIGFRHRTTVETRVVVHHARTSEKLFLHSYLYGPQPSS